MPNYVSAQLLLQQADLTPFTVRDKYIRTVQLGEDLGIEGAPAGLPAAAELVDDGWTACTASGTGIKIAIQQTPAVEDLTGSVPVTVAVRRPAARVTCSASSSDARAALLTTRPASSCTIA